LLFFVPTVSDADCSLTTAKWLFLP
jgi:hypothetical protein